MDSTNIVIALGQPGLVAQLLPDCHALFVPPQGGLVVPAGIIDEADVAVGGSQPRLVAQLLFDCHALFVPPQGGLVLPAGLMNEAEFIAHQAFVLLFPQSLKSFQPRFQPSLALNRLAEEYERDQRLCVLSRQLYQALILWVLRLHFLGHPLCAAPHVLPVHVEAPPVFHVVSAVLAGYLYVIFGVAAAGAGLAFFAHRVFASQPFGHQGVQVVAGGLRPELQQAAIHQGLQQVVQAHEPTFFVVGGFAQLNVLDGLQSGSAAKDDQQLQPVERVGGRISGPQVLDHGVQQFRDLLVEFPSLQAVEALQHDLQRIASQHPGGQLDDLGVAVGGLGQFPFLPGDGLLYLLVAPFAEHEDGVPRLQAAQVAVGASAQVVKLRQEVGAHGQKGAAAPPGVEATQESGQFATLFRFDRLQVVQGQEVGAGAEDSQGGLGGASGGHDLGAQDAIHSLKEVRQAKVGDVPGGGEDQARREEVAEAPGQFLGQSRLADAPDAGQGDGLHVVALQPALDLR